MSEDCLGTGGQLNSIACHLFQPVVGIQTIVPKSKLLQVTREIRTFPQREASVKISGNVDGGNTEDISRKLWLSSVNVCVPVSWLHVVRIDAFLNILGQFQLLRNRCFQESTLPFKIHDCTEIKSERQIQQILRQTFISVLLKFQFNDGPFLHKRVVVSRRWKSQHLSRMFQERRKKVLLHKHGSSSTGDEIGLLLFGRQARSHKETVQKESTRP